MLVEQFLCEDKLEHGTVFLTTRKTVLDIFTDMLKIKADLIIERNILKTGFNTLKTGYYQYMLSKVKSAH